MKKISFLLVFSLSVLILVAGSFVLLAEDSDQLGKTEFIPLEPQGRDEIQPLEGKGPHGEKPVGVGKLKDLITEEDAEKLREGNYTAAVCMHFLANDWSALQVKGIRAILDKYNVELLTVTDGKLKIEKQISDYETVAEMKPDLIITIPLDSDATAPVLKKIKNKGIELSFIDSVPTGFEHPEDYAGMATADNYANGRVSAEILIDRLDGEGEVALLNYKYSMFHTEQRSEAARDTFKAAPGIEIVAQQDVENGEEASSVTENLLVSHPDLDGIWAVWDGAGIPAARIAENLNKDVKVTTVDLSVDSAKLIAQDKALVGTGTQHPYDQGMAEALIGLAALVGKEPPAYVLVPGEKVTKGSLNRSWFRVFRREMPKEIKDYLD